MQGFNCRQWNRNQDNEAVKADAVWIVRNTTQCINKMYPQMRYGNAYACKVYFVSQSLPQVCGAGNEYGFRLIPQEASTSPQYEPGLMKGLPSRTVEGWGKDLDSSAKLSAVG